MNILNPSLVEKQNLTTKQIRSLENLHLAMQKCKETPIEDIEDIEAYVKHIQEMEFKMQNLWGFPEDASYHTHWYTDPKCSCPKLDNKDLQGINRHIISASCKLHGGT